MAFEIKATISVSPEPSAETMASILDGLEWWLEEQLNDVHDIQVNGHPLAIGLGLEYIAVSHGYSDSDATYYQEEE